MMPLACIRVFLAFILVAANIAATIAHTTTAVSHNEEFVQALHARSQDAFQTRINNIEQLLEAKRKELGVPGMSVAIVKDSKIVYTKGFGSRDVEKNLPVTPETLFPIGSSTKAFTGMLMAMSADDGKLSFTDSPHKYLPYFKLQDPEANKKITLRDLMIHNSGLARTEFIWYPGVLNREEVIRAVGEAKPTAPFGEKYQYQNVMVTAAGEAIAKAQNSTWEKLMNERILKPLGMKQTTLTLPAMQKSKDYALGYEYDNGTKKTERIPFRSQDALWSAAPAGSVYSNAREMGEWVRFILAGGVFDGKRLISEKNFNEIISPQFKDLNGSNVDYGLGWYLINRKGKKVIQHGGSIDGFRAQVSMMPEENLGFVILTNSYKTPLIAADIGGGVAEEIIWTNLVDEQKADSKNESKNTAPAEDAQQEVGKYRIANLTVEVAMRDGRLVLNVPGQPGYPLENVGGRRYKFAGDEPAAQGYFVTFRPAESGGGKTELFLEQPPPKRNINLTKVDSEAAKSSSVGGEQYKDITRVYEAEVDGKKLVFQLVMQDGKLTVTRPGQRSLTLVEKGKDAFGIEGAPDTYKVNIQRNAAGKVTGLLINQPDRNIEFKRAESFESPVSAEELMAKVIYALGGEANIQKHKTQETVVEINLVNQGVVGTGTISVKAPNLKSTRMEFFALGKKLGTLHEYFNGTTGGTESSFLLPEKMSEKELSQERVTADFYAPLKWRELYKTVEVRGITKVGEEESYIVVKTPENGAPVTDYISTKSFLPLRSDTLQGITKYSDYRKVDGVMLPFKWTIESPGTGEQIITVRSSKFDIPIPESAFYARDEAIPTKKATQK
ncbi:MAG TPA: serine hydrolase [Pyrinomonadaceae bacterium]